MTKKSSISFKVAALVLSATLLALCVIFLTKLMPEPDESSSMVVDQHAVPSAPPADGTSDNQIAAPGTFTGNGAYAWLRSLIEANALKEGKSVTESAIEHINAAKLKYGTASGTYDSLVEAFWDEPEVFLDSLKATAQGDELQFATAVYISRADKAKSIDHFSKAYNTLNPGSARRSVSNCWVRVVGSEQGIDAAISLIIGLEFPEEKRQAAFALEQLIQRDGLELSSEQRNQLALLIRAK